ncbi:MAG: zinc ribbon domain-containing protein [Ruminococcus sp.]|nr:zinc ribbon domain-containing protein [Ruminococcus sp.]
MSLILCPECGTKISDKATQCPHCGFQSEDSTRPISEQDKFEIYPTFEYDIEGWQANRGNLSVISYEDNKSFIGHFGKWNTIKTELPAIAEVISAMAQKEHIMVAKMDTYVKELIAKGVYRFSIDKQGEILPTIRDGKNIVNQVRLEDMTFSPNLIQALNNLSIHATMAQILDEIEFIGDAIREIHIELQNDRLAMADSARDKLFQARRIQDSKLRETALLAVIGTATDAKRALMRNFSQNLLYIRQHSNESDFKQIFKKSDTATKATDALQALVAITSAVQTECEGYAILGEYEPCKICLEEFKCFIVDNSLEKRDTLLLINESSSVKKIDIVNQFCDISQRITAFDVSSQIEMKVHELLTESDNEENGGESDE